MDYWTIDDIRLANRNAGFYFFSPDTMRFFRSRVGGTVYQGNGGIYFVTSEQFDYNSERLYTVRRFNPDTRGIETASEFNTMSRYAANVLAKELAKG